MSAHTLQQEYLYHFHILFFTVILRGTFGNFLFEIESDLHKR